MSDSGTDYTGSNLNSSSTDLNNTILNSQVKSFRFTGQGWEYFKIWIVNILLSILTLGIYSAWATVRNNRYFYGNTLLDGASFEYHGQPMQILKGRIIAVGVLFVFSLITNILPIVGNVLAVLLILSIPFLIWSSYRFTSNMSSYRNIRFSFTMPLKKAYMILGLPFLIAAVSFGLVILVAYLTKGSGGGSSVGGMFMMVVMLSAYLSVPFFQAFIQRNFYSHVTYGKSELKSEISAVEYYKIYLRTIGWSIIVSIAFGIAVTIVMSIFGSFFNAETLSLLTSDDPETQKFGLMAIAGAGGLSLLMLPIGFILFFTYVQAYMIAQFRNHKFNTASLPGVQLDSSVQATSLMWLLLTNTLLFIVTLGLFYPWAKVRLANFLAQATAVTTENGLDHFIADQQKYVSAVGDELGDAFDADMDLGIGL